MDKNKNATVVLILLWLTANLLQARFTELTDDEAYYWMYSRYFDYGYFDHPPAIALMIKAGYFLFKNELGVRFFTVLFTTVSVWLLFKLSGAKNFKLYLAVLASMSIVEAYSFVAVPDVPLLFSSIIFFYMYKRFLEGISWKNTVLLGLSVAMMLYSKYHGILVVFFTLLSNLSLLKRKDFYLVAGLAILFYLPHILWQINHDYPSYQYHILNKSQDPYDPEDTINYLLGQLLVAGPFVGFFLYYMVFRHKAIGQFERALKFTFIGILAFFLLASINSRIEPNWTLVAMVPLILLVYPRVEETVKLKKWIGTFTILSMGLFVFFRLNLVFDFVPEVGSKAFPEFFHNNEWAEQIQKMADGKPVVFCNSYQRPAKYTFYTGETAMSLNNISYRRNQYDFWPIEDSLQGKRIMYVPNWDTQWQQIKTIETKKERVFGLFIDNFRSYTKVQISTGENSYKFKSGEVVSIPLKIMNNYAVPVRFGQNNDFPETLVYCLFREETPYLEKPIMDLKGFRLNNQYETSFMLSVPKEAGIYYLRISIRSGFLPPLINSRLMRIVVE